MVEIKPKIDRQFWFDMSEEIVNGSGLRLTEAVNKLYNFVVWIYSVFTACAILTFKFNESAQWLVYLLPFPFVLIITAGVLCISAQMPVPVNFDYRVADTIESAYEKNILIRIKRLKLAQILTVVGSLGTSVIIFYSFVFRDNNPEAPVKTVYIDAGYQKAEAQILNVSMTGYCLPRTSVKYNVIARDSVSGTDKVLVSRHFFNSISGDFIHDFSSPTQSGMSDYRISLEWRDENKKETTLAITQTMKDFSQGK